MTVKISRHGVPVEPAPQRGEPAHDSDASDALDDFVATSGRRPRGTRAGARQRRAPRRSASPRTIGAPALEDCRTEIVWLDETDGLDEFVSRARPADTTVSTALVVAEPMSLAPVPSPTPDGERAVVGDDIGASAIRGGWMMRAARAAVVCAVLAAVADRLPIFNPPAGPGTTSPDATVAPITDAVEHLPKRPGIATAAPDSSTPARAVRDASTGNRALLPMQTRGSLPPAVKKEAAIERSVARLPPVVAPPSRSTVDQAPTATLTGRVVRTPELPSAPAPAVEPAVAAAESDTPALAASVAPSGPTTNDKVPIDDAAIPPPTVPPPIATPMGERETRDIRNVLGRYRDAFNRLDTGSARAIWPTVNQDALTRAFDRLAGQDISFDDCRIEVSAVVAEAACLGNARYVPKIGSRTPRAEARRWTFSLRKAADGWLIDRVDAR